MWNLKKQTKTQVLAAIRKNGYWKGWLVGNKVNTFHIKHGYHLGVDVNITSEEDLETLCNMLLRNLEPELGNRITFYVDC